MVLFSLFLLIISTRYEKQGGALYSPVHTKLGRKLRLEIVRNGSGTRFHILKKVFLLQYSAIQLYTYIGNSFRRPEQKTGYHCKY